MFSFKLMLHQLLHLFRLPGLLWGYKRDLSGEVVFTSAELAHLSVEVLGYHGNYPCWSLGSALTPPPCLSISTGFSLIFLKRENTECRRGYEKEQYSGTQSELEADDPICRSVLLVWYLPLQYSLLVSLFL